MLTEASVCLLSPSHLWPLSMQPMPLIYPASGRSLNRRLTVLIPNDAHAAASIKSVTPMRAKPAPDNP
ncbi:Outer membrane protein OmpA and related peptidoglycan-associated (lipo)protein [Pseudomonas syringae pv. actinidiae]|uniref:Outer membrane protein OmpA and related peptidoglycan-associated (Lipo)protein n=1 Tax=Pseudomonas syringae pv. actinidiae TaxID=103796 RepID=A0A2V0QN58_PSESF|nr:Outer membrane protein OmpA and related peptidoglycan-associated (lipo)protein [Pseudomonas syringae pv. actinidiae]